MSNYEEFDPATIAEHLKAALSDRFPRPIRVNGVLSDWRATPKFGRGKITSEGDPNAHLPVGMQMWRVGGGTSHLAKGQHVGAVGSLQWHPTFGLQLMATSIRAAGVSERHQSVLELRASLANTATTSPQRRLAVNQPARIAILGPHGGAAALTDARSVLKAVPSDVHLFTHRIPMGGPAAPTAIAKALLSLSRSADLILIVRGGGSTTDLAVWDDPSVVERISQCPVPIVVGVGHSIDTTAAGHAAYHCAITPTAAAQWVVDLYVTAPRPQAGRASTPHAERHPAPPRRPLSPTPIPPPGHKKRRTQVRPRPATAATLGLAILVGLILIALH